MTVRCASCDPTGRGRYCARHRCYCGHPDCWAADSYVELPPPGQPIYEQETTP